MERGLTKNEIVNQLSRSSHGKLAEYAPIVLQAAKQEPEFLAHLISWNAINGQVRDSKVALPVISLSEPTFHEEFVDNSLAHLVSLDPRLILKAVRFGKEIKAGRSRAFHRVVRRYLKSLESNWAKWSKTAVQHRDSLRALYQFPYSGGKIIPLTTPVKNILFEREYPKGSIFWKLAHLNEMTPLEAAGVIIEDRVPFLVATAALGSKIKDPDIALALINRMSPTELVTHTPMLQSMGVKTNPALRAAYEEALQRASVSKKTTLKATKAAENIDDETLKAKMNALQEKQLKVVGIDGDWAVLGDRSPSMSACIEASRHLAATLAKMVKGKVHLIFFDATPMYIDVTGLTYDQILKATKHIGTGSTTSIGCGLQRLLNDKIAVDAIAIVSDAKENTAPFFAERYQRYVKVMDKEPPVYLYRFAPNSSGYADTDLAESMKKAGIELQEFDLRHGTVDYYSLPNLTATMRVNRYGLIDKIMETPLLTVDGVLGPVKERAVTHA